MSDKTKTPEEWAEWAMFQRNDEPVVESVTIALRAAMSAARAEGEEDMNKRAIEALRAFAAEGRIWTMPEMCLRIRRLLEGDSP